MLTQGHKTAPEFKNRDAASLGNFAEMPNRICVSESILPEIDWNGDILHTIETDASPDKV